MYGVSLVKIDVKDKKILYELDKDSRQSFNSIGKKVGLTKDNVSYRVKRLQEKGIIVNFRSNIHFGSLSYLYSRAYYNFQNTNPTIKKEIIDHFVNSKETVYVTSLEGVYDLMVVVPFINALKFNSFLQKIQFKFGDYIGGQVSSIYLISWWYDLAFLLDKKIEEREVVRGIDERDLPKFFTSPRSMKIESLDFKILKVIANDARIPTTEIAKRLNSTVTQIHHRINKLIDSGLIGGFGVTVDLRKIGYRFYHVDINLKKLTRRFDIIDYVKLNPHLYCVEKAIGHAADLELEFYFENVEHLHNVMEDISLKFPESIKNFKYFSYLKNHKYSVIPNIDRKSPYYSRSKSLKGLKIITALD